MEPFTLLALLALAMLAGAFGSGLLPLSYRFQPAHLRLMTAGGAGVLIGTTLLIIIPEAVATLHGGHDHAAGELVRFGLDPFRAVGLGLAAGFLFMLLVENLGLPHALHDDDCPTHTPGSMALVGLTLHAAVDGVALGSAVASETPAQLGAIVFLAVMLHKGPAAFSLSAIQLQGGCDRRRVVRNLALFSLAAPVLALATFLTLGELHQGDVALALLFSGGTFLYVATVDVMPEIHTPGERRWPQVLALVAGMALAALVSRLGHGH